jgi:hypothetical protein
MTSRPTPATGSGTTGVSTGSGEPGPGVEERRPAGHDHGDRVAPAGVGLLERGGQRRQRVGGLGVEDGLVEAAGTEVH